MAKPGQNPGRGLPLFGEPQDLPDHLVGVAPFVIVPAKDLDQVAVHHLGHAGVENGGMGIHDDIGGDDGIGGVFQDILIAAVGLFFKISD